MPVALGRLTAFAPLTEIGESVKSRGLQRSRPSAEPGIQSDRGLAPVADGTLNLLEISRSEIVSLPQVGTLGCGFSARVGWNRSELAREPPGKLGELSLAAPDLLQSLDQIRTLAIGLFEQPAESEAEAVRA